MDSSFWLNLGIAGAVVVVVKLFLYHLRHERDSCDACRKEHGQLVSNHIDHEREALEKLTDAIRSLQTLLRECLNPSDAKDIRR